MKNSFQIQLKETKRLRSGRCQVKFACKEDGSYGYVLVEAKATLKEVISEICDNYMQLKSGPFLSKPAGKVATAIQTHNFVLIQK